MDINSCWLHADATEFALKRLFGHKKPRETAKNRLKYTFIGAGFDA
jgi:hypothetical protein